MKTIKLKMRKLSRLLFLTPLFSISQNFSVVNPDKNIEPNPFEKVYFEDKNNYKNIDSKVTISKNRSKNFAEDTLRINYYNSFGLESKVISYLVNKPNYTSIMNYNKEKNISNQQTIENKNTSLILFYYNKNSQLERMRELNIKHTNNKIDTTDSSQKTFNYDKLKLIDTQNSYYNSTFKLIEKYYYTNNILIKKTNRSTLKEFKYDGS
jgi:hypothetical protein